MNINIVESDKLFRKIFNKNFRKYFHPILGFDIVKFDVDIETPEGMSTKDFINSKYGIRAVELIEGFLNYSCSPVNSKQKNMITRKAKIRIAKEV